MDSLPQNELIETLLKPLRDKIDEHYIKFCVFSDQNLVTIIIGEQFDYGIAKAKAESTNGFRSLLQICIQNKILCCVIATSHSPIDFVRSCMMNRKLKNANRFVDKEIITFLSVITNPCNFFHAGETLEQIQACIEACDELFDEIERYLREIHQS